MWLVCLFGSGRRLVGLVFLLRFMVRVRLLLGVLMVLSLIGSLMLTDQGILRLVEWVGCLVLLLCCICMFLTLSWTLILLLMVVSRCCTLNLECPTAVVVEKLVWRRSAKSPWLMWPTCMLSVMGWSMLCRASLLLMCSWLLLSGLMCASMQCTVGYRCVLKKLLESIPCR